jgi:hypothetical protein
MAGPGGQLKPEQIVALFAQLPGDTAFKILAPDAKGKKPFIAQLNSDRMLFVASAIKTFALCEAVWQGALCPRGRRCDQESIAPSSAASDFCAMDDQGKVKCLTKPGGGAAMDSYGKVKCLGGCQNASEQRCEAAR